jgi:hypothetical protein
MFGLEANRKLVQEQWEAVNRGDMAAAAAYFAERTSATTVDPSAGRECLVL